jgi:hypothetical protein
MRNPRRLADLAILLPIGAVLLFTPPYVGLMDGAATLFGLPALHLYIFGAWGLGIVLTALVARRLKTLEDDPPHGPGRPSETSAVIAPPDQEHRSDGDGI